MQRRGQAFETMMLVISVIVALAILAVLLNVLNIANIFNPSDPGKTMASGLKEIQSKGFGITAPQKVQFSKGSVILPAELIADIPIKSTDVEFFCETSEDVCSPSSDEAFPLNVIDNKRITVNANIDASVVVCGNEPRYCIVLARDPNEASDVCIDECGLE